MARIPTFFCCEAIPTQIDRRRGNKKNYAETEKTPPVSSSLKLLVRNANEEREGEESEERESWKGKMRENPEKTSKREGEKVGEWRGGALSDAVARIPPA